MKKLLNKTLVAISCCSILSSGVMAMEINQSDVKHSFCMDNAKSRNTITEEKYDEIIDLVVDETISEILENWKLDGERSDILGGHNSYSVISGLDGLKIKMEEYEKSVDKTCTIEELGKLFTEHKNAENQNGVCRNRAYTLAYKLRNCGADANVVFLNFDPKKTTPKQKYKLNHAVVLTRITDVNGKDRYVITDPMRIANLVAKAVEEHILDMITLKGYEEKPTASVVKKDYQNWTASKKFQKYPFESYVNFYTNGDGIILSPGFMIKDGIVLKKDEIKKLKEGNSLKDRGILTFEEIKKNYPEILN